MNKYIAIFSIILIPFCGKIYSNEENLESSQEDSQPTQIHKSFTYLRFDYGVPILFALNIGKRVQANQHAFDLSVGQICSSVDVIGIQSHMRYLFFPKPHIDSQYYLGIGLNSFLAFSKDYLVSTQPELALGKEYYKKNGKQRFLELRIAYCGITKRSYHQHERYDTWLSKLRNKWKTLPTIQLCHGIQF